MTNDNNIKNVMNIITQLTLTLTHDLSTHLVAIKLGANATKDYLPRLIDGYLLAQHYDLNVTSIPSCDLEILSRTVRNIESEAGDALIHLNELVNRLKVIEHNLCNNIDYSCNEN